MIDICFIFLFEFDVFSVTSVSFTVKNKGNRLVWEKQAFLSISIFTTNLSPLLLIHAALQILGASAPLITHPRQGSW